MQGALEHNAGLRVAFTVYSFITLFLFAPAPALGNSTQAEITPASASLGSGVTAFTCDIPRETLFLPGGDPAALENGDSLFTASPAVSSSTPGYRSKTGF
jgi:hypothetical protein